MVNNRDQKVANLAEELTQIAETGKTKPVPEPKNVGRKQVGPESKEDIKAIPYKPESNRQRKEIAQLALDENTNMTALIHEGLEMLFKSRGKDFDSYK